MMSNTYFSPLELKFQSDSTGEFEGYGAVFGNEDSHGDVIMRGAFEASLEEHRKSRSMPRLYIEHSAFVPGGDRLPAGVWLDVREDTKGLRCRGKISALDTDYGRRIIGLMKDGALKGLSIAFNVPPGGAVFGKKPKRELKSVNVHAIDLVTSPSNAQAQVEHVKSTLALIERDRVAPVVRRALALTQASLSGGDSPTKQEREELVASLLEIDELFGPPEGVKSAPETIRGLEKALRELGYSNSRARAIAEAGLKSQQPREEGGDLQANRAAKEVADELGSILSGFSLPKFRG